MKYLLILISCVAISPAYADVIALDGAVVVGNGRDMDRDDDRRNDEDDYYHSNAYGLGRSLYDYDNTVIINNPSRNSGTLIVDDGKIIRPEAGTHILNNGQSLDVDEDGRASGRIGDVEIQR